MMGKSGGIAGDHVEFYVSPSNERIRARALRIGDFDWFPACS